MYKVETAATSSIEDAIEQLRVLVDIKPDLKLAYDWAH